MLGKYKSFAGLHLVILPVFFILLSCSDDEVDVTKLQPTELEVTVLNEAGQPVAGAEVRLFRSQRDFELINREVTGGITGGDGKVLFSGLLPVNYYIYAFYKDEAAGLIRSNYGNFSEEYFERFSNISLFDYLTENAITKVSVSTLFSKPINPDFVSIEELIITYIGSETEASRAAPDTLDILFALFIDFDPFEDVNNQLNNQLTRSQYSNYFFQELNESAIGFAFEMPFDSIISLDLNQALQNGEFGSFDPYIDLVPLVYNDTTGDYEFQFYLSDMYPVLDNEFYSAIYNARQSGVYPNRVVVSSDAFLGKTNYVMDFVLSWN